MDLQRVTHDQSIRNNPLKGMYLWKQLWMKSHER